MSIDSQLKKAEEQKKANDSAAAQQKANQKEKTEPEQKQAEPAQQGPTDATKDAEQIGERVKAAEEVKRIAEKTEAEQKQAEPAQQGPTDGAKDAEQMRERAKDADAQKQQSNKQAQETKDRASKEADKKTAEKSAQEAMAAQHANQVEFNRRVKEARAEDTKQYAENKAAAAAEKKENTLNSKPTNGPKLERGGDGVDLRNLGTTYSTGNERMSKETTMTDFTQERDLRGAGTEHLQQKGYGSENYLPYPERFGTNEQRDALAQASDPSAKNWNLETSKAWEAKFKGTTQQVATPSQQQPAVEQVATPSPTPAVEQEAQPMQPAATPEQQQPAADPLQAEYEQAKADHKVDGDELEQLDTLNDEELADQADRHATERKAMSHDPITEKIGATIHAAEKLDMLKSHAEERKAVMAKREFPSFESWKTPQVTGELQSQAKQLETYNSQPSEVSNTLRSMSFTVDTGENITYKLQDAEIFKDTGKSIEIMDANSDAGIAAAMATAQQKFGDTLKLTGPQSTCENIARVCVEQGLTCKFADPKIEAFREQLQSAKNIVDGVEPAQAKSELETPAPVQKSGTAIQPTASPVLLDGGEVQQPAKENDVDQRYGAEAIKGTQASKDRDEMNAEAGKGYRELPADQVTNERVREGDGFKDLVPEQEPAPAPEPEIEDDYEDDYGL